MKNNTFYKVNKQKDTDRLIKSGSVCSFCLLIGLLSSQESHAQFYNKGEVTVQDNTILSVYEDYDNTTSGTFTNNGDVYIFKDWNNDGIVNFDNQKNGKTSFVGETEQQISGGKTAEFQNIIFDNLTSLMPFQLSTSISVNNLADFKSGIIDADTKNGLVIFEKEAFHDETSDLSFVDGKVQKIGTNNFEFPVGDELYYRPSYHGAGAKAENVYTTQYFYQNSDIKHSHALKEKTIQKINDSEYWTVTKDQGSENIILSLTIDSRTTPSEFLNVSSNKKVVIVRWDDALGQWVSEGGDVSDKMPGAKNAVGYTQLLTSQVRGYGMFTMAIVEEEIPDNELTVYNAVSPNGDGINDNFHIKGIDQYPDNSIEIYNRWGVKVYDAKSYNETDNMFRGYSDGRATINRNEKLPTGTYFYILKYNTGKKVKEKTGYLYINNQ